MIDGECTAAMSSGAAAVRVALVEDHEATRAALLQTLGDFGSRVTVVAALASAEALLGVLHATSIDVALIDLGLPGMSGAALIRVLKTRAPNLRTLALSAFDDDATVLDAVRAGALGYLLKDEPADRLVRSIEEAAAGAHPISSRVAGYLMSQARLAPPPVLLSDREEELAVALAQGLSYAQCSERMGIAMGTVQDYVKRVYRKLDINSKKEVRDWVSRYASHR